MRLKQEPTDHNSQLCFVCGTWTPYGFGPPGWLKSIWACPAHVAAAEARRVGARPAAVDPVGQLVRVTAPHFVAGMVMEGDVCVRAEPILV